MSWTKLHSDAWLYGSIRKYDPEIRAVWLDLQAFADICNPRGKICITENLPFSLDQLSKLFNTKCDILKKALKIFSDLENYIEIDDKNVIILKDWVYYQSEYQRLKQYKKKDTKGTSKGTKKGTLGSNKKKYGVDVDVDIENTRRIEPIKTVFNDFLEMRKKIKKPTTSKAVKLILNKLQEIAPDDNDTKIKILEQSIINSWQGVFPLKDQANQKSNPKPQKEVAFYGSHN